MTHRNQPLFTSDACGRPLTVKRSMYEINISAPQWIEFHDSPVDIVSFEVAELMGLFNRRELGELVRRVARTDRAVRDAPCTRPAA